MKHTLEFNGYHVGDRLLEDVFFHVEVTETPDNLVIGKVTWDDDEYTKRINMGTYVDEVKDYVQPNIDHIKSLATKQSITLTQLLDDWEVEVKNTPGLSGLGRIDILNEV